MTRPPSFLSDINKLKSDKNQHKSDKTSGASQAPEEASSALRPAGGGLLGAIQKAGGKAVTTSNARRASLSILKPNNEIQNVKEFIQSRWEALREKTSNDKEKQELEKFYEEDGIGNSSKFKTFGNSLSDANIKTNSKEYKTQLDRYKLKTAIDFLSADGALSSLNPTLEGFNGTVTQGAVHINRISTTLRDICDKGDVVEIIEFIKKYPSIIKDILLATTQHDAIRQDSSLESLYSLPLGSGCCEQFAGAWGKAMVQILQEGVLDSLPQEVRQTMGEGAIKKVWESKTLEQLESDIKTYEYDLATAFFWKKITQEEIKREIGSQDIEGYCKGRYNRDDEMDAIIQRKKENDEKVADTGGKARRISQQRDLYRGYVDDALNNLIEAQERLGSSELIDLSSGDIAETIIRSAQEITTHNLQYDLEISSTAPETINLRIEAIKNAYDEEVVEYEAKVAQERQSKSEAKFQVLQDGRKGDLPRLLEIITEDSLREAIVTLDDGKFEELFESAQEFSVFSKSEASDESVRVADEIRKNKALERVCEIIEIAKKETKEAHEAEDIAAVNGIKEEKIKSIFKHLENHLLRAGEFNDEDPYLQFLRDLAQNLATALDFRDSVDFIASEINRIKEAAASASGKVDQKNNALEAVTSAVISDPINHHNNTSAIETEHNAFLSPQGKKLIRGHRVEVSSSGSDDASSSGTQSPPSAQWSLEETLKETLIPPPLRRVKTSLEGGGAAPMTITTTPPPQTSVEGSLPPPLALTPPPEALTAMPPAAQGTRTSLGALLNGSPTIPSRTRSPELDILLEINPDLTQTQPNLLVGEDEEESVGKKKKKGNKGTYTPARPDIGRPQGLRWPQLGRNKNTILSEASMTDSNSSYGSQEGSRLSSDVLDRNSNGYDGNESGMSRTTNSSVNSFSEVNLPKYASDEIKKKYHEEKEGKKTPLSGKGDSRIKYDENDPSSAHKFSGEMESLYRQASLEVFDSVTDPKKSPRNAVGFPFRQYQFLQNQTSGEVKLKINNPDYKINDEHKVEKKVEISFFDYIKDLAFIEEGKKEATKFIDLIKGPNGIKLTAQTTMSELLSNPEVQTLMDRENLILKDSYATTFRDVIHQAMKNIALHNTTPSTSTGNVFSL